MAQASIFTIGYGWSTLDGMVKTIKDATDASRPILVADVRLAEGRVPEFFEAALKAGFEAAGFSYTHYNALGNTNPSHWNGNPSVGAWLPPDVEKALEACAVLADLVLTGTQVVLLCGEARPFFEDQQTGRQVVKCHRVFVSQVIRHLCGGGEIRALFAPQTRRPAQKQAG